MQKCPKCGCAVASMEGQPTDKGDMVRCVQCGTKWERALDDESSHRLINVAPELVKHMVFCFFKLENGELCRKPTVNHQLFCAEHKLEVTRQYNEHVVNTLKELGIE